jgi:tetratricopeptide (TPR) repeat protein
VGVVKLGCSGEGVCKLSLADWLELQYTLGIRIVKTHSFGSDLVTRQRIKLWKRLGLSDEEVKALKIIREKHLLYQKYLDVYAEYKNMKNEFNVLKEFLSEKEIMEYESKLRHLRLQLKVAYSHYRKRVERINNYRKALERTFESFRPLHSLPVVVVKSIIRPLLNELDMYLLLEMFKTVRLIRKRYAIAIRSYVQTLELANELIIEKAIKCLEQSTDQDIEQHNECGNWRLKMKALQHVAVKFLEHFVDNVPLIYEIVDAKPNSELLVRILTS